MYGIINVTILCIRKVTVNMELQKLKITHTNNADVEFSLKKADGGIAEYAISMHSDEKIVPEKICIDFEVPYKEMFTVWNPETRAAVSLHPDWIKRNVCESRAAANAPVQSLIGKNDENRMTVAVSDSLTPINISFGIHEEDAQVKCQIVFFALPVSALNSYTALIRIDSRHIPFYESLRDVKLWWNETSGYTDAFVPETARTPMYSTWYSFHQELEPEKLYEQCRISKKLGCDAIIVDDGWQTADNNHGYAYCGDWELYTGKIPDMRVLTDTIHEIGMKVMLWYSVPFVGIHSKAWNRFKDKFLNYAEDKQWCCLDPRYTEVRDYLTGIYEKAAIEWGIDGFKLDFIDSFALTENSASELKDGMDCIALEDGIKLLLEETMTKLRKINPDICIEFRQRYIGPLMQSYGNMLRVSDCPGDALTNRTGMVSLRLITGKTAVHSDMLMWHKTDTAEYAALQLLNILFSVPQISVMLNEIPDSHFKMVKFYLDFWCKNRDTLLDGEFRPKYYDANYGLIETESSNKIIACAYSVPMLELADTKKSVVLINAGGRDTLFIKGLCGNWNYTVYDCCGNVKEASAVSFDKKAEEFSIPMSGMIVLDRQ